MFQESCADTLRTQIGVINRKVLYKHRKRFLFDRLDYVEFLYPCTRPRTGQKLFIRYYVIYDVRYYRFFGMLTSISHSFVEKSLEDKECDNQKKNNT